MPLLIKILNRRQSLRFIKIRYFNYKEYKKKLNHFMIFKPMTSNFRAQSENQEFRFEQAFKQFSLETERLETVFQSLQKQFKSAQDDLQETRTKLYSKLAELECMTCYLDAILHHILQGILFIDLYGIVTTYNPMADELLGVKSSAILFHSFWDFLPDNLFGFSLKEMLETKQAPKDTFTSWILPNGKQMELEIETTFIGMQDHLCAISPFHSSQTPTQGLLILIRNITEIRHLQRLANRHERLKQLGELAAMVAHEIRNPLGGIKGFATLLQEDLKNQPALQQMATSIIAGTDSLERFVTNVLNYARPFQPHLESMDLVSFMRDMLNLIQADNAFNSQIFCHLYTSFSELTVPMDSSLFKTAILNLLVNALQAMPQGGELSIKLDKIPGYALIDIRDSGIGIEEKNLEKIFSLFFTTKDSGHGFGLAEVHKVIQAHQGTIDVQSKVGSGTVFSIKIPLKLS